MRHSYDPIEAIAHLPESERGELLLEEERPAPRLGPGEFGASAEFWRDKQIVVTGSQGFLGTYVERRLRRLGCGEIVVPEAAGYDLLEQGQVRQLFRDVRPHIVLHLAEQIGGIGANRENPGRFFYANLVMGTHLIEEARLAGVEKFVQLGTICSYPKYTPVPFREEDLWNGFPDESSAAYGIAKRALLVQLQAYRAQYGFNGICLLPVNLYGPGDDYDLQRSYVIPALVRKIFEAKVNGAPTVEVWGSGEVSREFLYVDDCARALLLAAEHYEGGAPVNLGTGREIKIRELAALLASLIGYEGSLVFDRSKPDGQPRRCLDVRKAHQLFGFKAHMGLTAGLRETIKWYRRHQEAQPDPSAVDRSRNQD